MRKTDKVILTKRQAALKPAKKKVIPNFKSLIQVIIDAKTTIYISPDKDPIIARAEYIKKTEGRKSHFKPSFQI